MRKVEFVKTKRGICAYLDDSLFNTASEQIIKIAKVINLFSTNIEKYEGTFFIDVKDRPIINDLHNLNCSFELIYTTKDFFKRDKEDKYKVIFQNEQIEQMIAFFLKNDLTFEGHGYKNDDEILLGVLINDHDGSEITFNDKIFAKENYKQLIKNIFKNNKITFTSKTR